MSDQLRVEIILHYSSRREMLVGRCDFHLPQTWEWVWRGFRPGWPTQHAWTTDYVDRDGRPHTLTVSEWEDPHTRVLVDGELADCAVDHTIQNPRID